MMFMAVKINDEYSSSASIGEQLMTSIAVSKPGQLKSKGTRGHGDSGNASLVELGSSVVFLPGIWRAEYKEGTANAVAVTAPLKRGKG